MAGDWLEQLEARLELQLETFLAANPAQQALLAEQEARDRQAALVGERSRLQRQAEQQRQQLLLQAEEIRAWRLRVERARAAGAEELAARAEAHVAGLMEQGRADWARLAQLGQAFAAVERELQELAERPGRQPPASRRASPEQDLELDLEQAWAAFEAEQELEVLRRRTATGSPATASSPARSPAPASSATASPVPAAAPAAAPAASESSSASSADRTAANCASAAGSPAPRAPAAERKAP